MKKRLSSALHSKLFWFLTALFFLSFALRFFLLPQNLFFGPEQGIDFFAIKSIAIDHHIKLVGAKTDIAGVLHGPIYYYLAVIPFVVSGGDPLVVIAFFILLNSLTVYFLYFLGSELYNKRVGIVSSILFTISFGLIVYARWLSSHPLIIPLSALFFLFLIRFLKTSDGGKRVKSKKDLFLTVVCLALLCQTQFLNYLFFPLLFIIMLIIFRKNFFSQKKIYLVSSIVLFLLVSISNYVLFEIKNGFIISKSLLNVAFRNKGYFTPYHVAFFATLSTLFRVVSTFIFPLHELFGALVYFVAIGLLLWSIKQGNKKSILLFFSLVTIPITIIITHHGVLDQFFLPMAIALLLGIAFGVDVLLKKQKVLGIGLLLIIIVVNVYSYVHNIPKNSYVFFQTTQPELKYSDELKVIDAIYTREKGRDFSFQAYTIPYWSQQGWEYLFTTYGKKKYGYVPVTHDGKTLYVIIQKDFQTQWYQDYWLKETVSHWGKPETSFKYGVLTIKVLKVE